MRKFSKKQYLAAGVAAAIITAGAGAAYAYWTTSGSGTGSAVVGTDQGVTLHGSAATPVTPDGVTSVVNFTADNSASGPQYVTSVSLASVDAYSDAAHTHPITGTGTGQCDTSAYSMATVTENFDVPSGSGNALPATGILKMSDTGSNQDGCKNAYLVLNLTSN